MSACPQCGSRSENEARFCGVCGHALEPAPSPPQEAPTPALRGPSSKSPSHTHAASPSSLHGGRPSAAGPSGGLALYGPSSSQDPYVGQELNGRFVVERKLGEGGFGAVYRGLQKVTGRTVALKLLHPEMTRDANVLARFRREGQVLCSLRDAHTITTYDFDQTPDGTLFIAMELLEGKSLHDIFSDEAPIAWTRMVKIVSEMCSSLQEAHEKGIVHRDLKPENIYLENRPGNSEFVKILDFGIAKVVRGDGIAGGNPQLTATGQTLGTLEYMSPEQLMGKQLDGRSDIYGLGVVTYELITGRLPFPDAIGPAALISAQLKKVPEPPSAANPGGQIPPEVDAMVLRMLEKDRARRYADVAELQAVCQELLAGMSPVTPVPGYAQPVVTGTPGAQPAAMAGAPAPVHSAPPAAAGQPMGPSTRAALAATTGSRMWVWVVVALAVIGGLVGGILALR